MAEYGRVYKRLWKKKAFRDADDQTKLMIVFVIAGPYINMVGYYYLPLCWIAHDLNWDAETTRKLFDNGQSIGLYTYDYEAEVVLVDDWFNWNGDLNPKQAKKAASQLSEVPQSCLEQQLKSYLIGYGKPYTIGLAKMVGLPSPETSPETESSCADNPIGSPHQTIIDYFRQEYESKYGIKYVVKGGKDGKAVHDLLKRHGEDGVKKLIDALFASDDKFYDKAGRTIGLLLAKENQLLLAGTDQGSDLAQALDDLDRELAR